MCHRRYSFKNGILDFLGKGEETEVITPFQRLMQFPPVTAIYERYWRPLGFFIASSASFGQFSEQLIELMDPSEQKISLDLACGPGLFTCPMARRTSGWVIGFDLSMPMLLRAARKAEAQRLSNVMFVRGSAFRLPFRDSAFSATLCSGALHLFDRPDLALGEIGRTLLPEGRLVCQTTIKPKHSAGIAFFLDRVIRFGFFKSPGQLIEKLRLAGMALDEELCYRIIYVFRAHRI
jgi:SAM-dependent methyltransferase